MGHCRTETGQKPIMNEFSSSSSSSGKNQNVPALALSISLGTSLTTPSPYIYTNLNHFLGIPTAQTNAKKSGAEVS